MHTTIVQSYWDIFKEIENSKKEKKVEAKLSRLRMGSWIEPVLLARINVSCSKTQHCEADEA